ncbi:suppressor protein SRP40 [Rhodamnia argentea]|uniref:Suppressor protein SRP40 n=1 Tax=Rhodamnia argentea TaxID=178133 RepID=A0A8B8PLH0_9MYRT|nr:suppressor protein SRP40 [Rhodamnia argentea]
MESLMFNYASSDEDEEVCRRDEPQSRLSSHSSPSKTTSSFSCLPPPKSSSSSLFSSLTQPKQTLTSSSSSSRSNPKTVRSDEGNSKSPAPVASGSSSRLFSSLPQPKQQSLSNLPPASANSSTRRIVQFRPPVHASLTSPSAIDDDEEDDEDEKEKERKRRRDSESAAQTSSVMSFLSSIPAPRNSSTLGALPSAGSGRRSVIETDASAVGSTGVESSNGSNNQTVGNYSTYETKDSGMDQNGGASEYHEVYGSYHGSYDQNASGSDISCYGAYENYSNHGEYGNYANNTDYATVASAGVVQEMSDGAVRASGKRGRNEIPAEIVEVKQDELMKNRPREDQVKLTGIAFGPSYQPVSTKGKPSKLHKRKHQIGTLYFDMKQKEMELAERRARGFLTKAQTHAKYGW